MILAEIKNYLMTRGRAPLSDIALHLESDPQAVRGMLDRWVHKGKVRKLPINSSCGRSCKECDPDTTEIYEWLDSDKAVVEQPVIWTNNCRK